MKKNRIGWQMAARKTWRQEIRHNWPLYLLIAPAFVFALIFCYLPMGGLVMAFQNYKPWLGILGSEFVGLENFRQIFEFQESYQAIINTLIIAVSKIILFEEFPPAGGGRRRAAAGVIRFREPAGLRLVGRPGDRHG